MDQRNLDLAKELYNALNRNDVEAALHLFDPQIVRKEFEGSPSAGSFKGLEELNANFVKGRSSWAEGSCTPERFIENEDKLVIFVHVYVRQIGKTEWIDAHIADGLRFEGGKIIEFHSFLKKSEALNWAGIEGEE